MMCSSFYNTFKSLVPVENNGSVSSVDVEKSRLNDSSADGQANTKLADPVEQITQSGCHLFCSKYCIR